MRKRTVLLISVLLLAAGFLAGRLSAPPSRFEPGAIAGDDPLEQAWENFISSQRESLSLLRNSEFYGDDQERAEAYRAVLYNLVGSIRYNALLDARYPRFARAVDWSSKSGLDNPDNNYYVAKILGDASYRVSGSRGSTTGLVFQVLEGEPGVGQAGTSTTISQLDAADLAIDADGNFEIILSPEDPGDAANWLSNRPGAGTLLVRYTHADWSKERAGRLNIERIGAAGEPAPPLTPNRMAQGLESAAISLFDRTSTWLTYAGRAWQLMPRNGISAARPTRGGLEGQYSAFGSWELDNDQALVITTWPGIADYQGLQLGNLWFASLDYETRISSLSSAQLSCAPDKPCKAVIAHRDPGVANWLDTGGHRRGLIMLRWQGLDGDLADSRQPGAELVPLAELMDSLPPNEPLLDADQRREQRNQRRLETQRRFDG